MVNKNYKKKIGYYTNNDFKNFLVYYSTFSNSLIYSNVIWLQFLKHFMEV